MGKRIVENVRIEGDVPIHGDHWPVYADTPDGTFFVWLNLTAVEQRESAFAVTLDGDIREGMTTEKYTAGQRQRVRSTEAKWGQQFILEVVAELLAKNLIPRHREYLLRLAEQRKEEQRVSIIANAKCEAAEEIYDCMVELLDYLNDFAEEDQPGIRQSCDRARDLIRKIDPARYPA
jgi:hypothetical protein